MGWTDIHRHPETHPEAQKGRGEITRAGTPDKTGIAVKGDVLGHPLLLDELGDGLQGGVGDKITTYLGIQQD